MTRQEVKGEESPTDRAIRAAIARHLRAHPRALDTANGIRQRWLDPVGVMAQRVLIVAVLDQMTQEGLLRRIDLPDGSILYGVGARDGEPG